MSQPKPTPARRLDAASLPNSNVQPSPWRFFSEWNKVDIPSFPCRYEIRYAPGGNPPLSAAGKTPTTSRLTPAEVERQIAFHELNSVLYIGKAVAASDRFWHLLETWKKNDGNSKNRKNHGSYNTWLRKSLQSRYPIADMQFRFVPVSNEVWKPPQNNQTDQIRAAFMNQDAVAVDNPASGAAFAAENTRLRLYENYFGIGTKPPLNTLGRGRKPMPEAELNAHLDALGQETPMSAEEQANALILEDAYNNPILPSNNQQGD